VTETPQGIFKASLSKYLAVSVQVQKKEKNYTD